MAYLVVRSTSSVVSESNSITTSGSESPLYSFQGGADGCAPIASLLDVNGTLYGTTTAGGTGTNCPTYNYAGCGTVFSITTSGSESVLYSFQGGTDGSYPAALIDVRGTLYGTTSTGSKHDPCPGGCGTLFKVTTSGKERVLYHFKGLPDGASPNGLTNVNGTLYGTTDAGGRSRCYGGCGTVFKATTSGEESVLYRFQGGTDGSYPAINLSLIDVNGTLYGTTQLGGTGSNCPPLPVAGCGTIFKITTSGNERVLHSFHRPTDASYGGGVLIDVSGELYGVSAIGGTGTNCSYGSYGCGTVFKTSL